MRSFKVRVPASSANLGPGFDALAIALDLWLEVHVELDESRTDIQDLAPPDLFGGENLVMNAMRFAAEETGRELPGCSIRINSVIPVARGMGSSAAAIVAGVCAGLALSRPGQTATNAEIINLAGRLEGHADNVAAAALGGVTAAVQRDSEFLAARLAADLPWTVLLYVPETSSLTREARGILPDRVSLEDAAANVGRAALLVHALATGSDEILTEAMRDRLHQPYRADIFPHLLDAIDAGIASGATGVCLSGAGPTILALARPGNAEAVGQAIAQVSQAVGIAGSIIQPGLASTGCHLLPDDD